MALKKPARRPKGSRIGPRLWYSARETVDLLDKEITELTVKEYCRTRKVRSQRKGPRKEWHVLGSEIIRLRKEWNLDS